ncbi:NADH-quinone oxidoreductase subunit N [Plantactinospora sp. KBS50]|uniref:NADH-quinone oxidoreductase subunit N n=1 Tax=Plantactinospora sp. KBS50 TaxID=2024580 RepID=UPI000BAA9BF7|nr:proton-conducting transporter membrane subunit [Plantactinospora sp. KBS50]ASW53512.1 NADH-quinone oxidoreductase subunit N [Plantactinospora sp. KBS50]
MSGIDHLALLPAYLAAGTAVLVLLVDLALARWLATLLTAAAGTVATAVVASLAGRGAGRATFCRGEDCSYLFTGRSALVAALFALLTLGVLALSAPLLRSAAVPAGEYCFLLACSMTGGVVLGSAADLITLVVALETLTLPLYVLVAARRTSRAGAEAAVTFFVVSVVASAVTLLGAALLYAGTGRLHLNQLGPALTGDLPAARVPLASAAVALVVLGLAFKVAAVPFHAWAPSTYDGAPLPVAGYLSTASKLGGVVALLAVTTSADPTGGSLPAVLGAAGSPALPVRTTGPVLAVLAVLTMTVGNLVALRQTRMVRLLAWSSVAQAGYFLAPLGALAVHPEPGAARGLAGAVLAYAVFYVLLEFAAFAAVVALRPAGADGGPIAGYRGAARRHPLVGAAFVLALVGLAGLPPGLAGLFAKVVVVRSLLVGGAGWLAVVVALNAVVGLAFYLRVAATLYAPAVSGAPVASGRPAASGRSGVSPGPAAPPARPGWAVAVALAVATGLIIVLGFAPQLVLDVAGR